MRHHFGLLRGSLDFFLAMLAGHRGEGVLGVHIVRTASHVLKLRVTYTSRCGDDALGGIDALVDGFSVIFFVGV